MRKSFYHVFNKCKEFQFRPPGIYTREVDRSFVIISGATSSSFIAGIDPAVKCPIVEYTQCITGRTDMLKVFGSAS